MTSNSARGRKQSEGSTSEGLQGHTPPSFQLPSEEVAPGEITASEAGDESLETDLDVANPKQAVDLDSFGISRTLSSGQDVLHPPSDRYFALIESLRNSGFEMCADLCGVDYLNHPARSLPQDVEPSRFEVVVNLLSLSQARRVRVRVQVPDEQPSVASLFSIYPGTEAMEREAFDMFGIRFAGHPDLTRILMPQDWEGHPLRKDFGIGRVPVRFKEAPSTR